MLFCHGYPTFKMAVGGLKFVDEILKQYLSNEGYYLFLWYFLLCYPYKVVLTFEIFVM